jgi:23S rRNA (pseudouridine1915-N3)-methyltransferase
MLNIVLICVGGLKESYLRDLAAEYEKRLGAYCRFRAAELRVDADIPKSIGKQAFVIAMTPEGEKLSSEGLAKRIESAAASGKSEIDFIIGGAEGLDEATKKAADLRLSMSDMTFPHRLARIMLTEQIYRCFTILNNEKYHK